MSKYPSLGCALFQQKYKPGDPRPDGYLEWHEWARVQHRAGLRQLMCGSCGKYRFPQEGCCTNAAESAGEGG